MRRRWEETTSQGGVPFVEERASLPHQLSTFPNLVRFALVKAFQVRDGSFYWCALPGDAILSDIHRTVGSYARPDPTTPLISEYGLSSSNAYSLYSGAAWLPGPLVSRLVRRGCLFAESSLAVTDSLLDKALCHLFRHVVLCNTIFPFPLPPYT